MITIPGVLCLVDWCLTISLWIYFQISKNKQQIQRRRIYFPKSRMIEFTCKKDLCRIIHEKKNCWYKKDITFTSFHWKREIKKYLSVMLYIDINEADLENKTNQFINDISKFNNKHIIKCYNYTISNIPE